MSARAFVKDDFMRDGVRIALLRRRPGDANEVVNWGAVSVSVVDGAAEPSADEWLPLSNDDARALYEALARHFGGGPDMTSLRRDYDAERARVDAFIVHLTRHT